jgi:acyl-CoA synthetase (AMP-forming)/AMP-acid ligase II
VVAARTGTALVRVQDRNSLRSTVFAEDVRQAIARASGITYGDVLETRARISTDHIAVEFEGYDISFGELNGLANQAAWTLMDHGSTQDVPVCILSENSLDYVALMYGCAKVGSPLAGINWRLTGPEIAAVLGATEPWLVFVSPEHRALMDEALDHLQPPRRPRVIELIRGAALGQRPSLSTSLTNSRVGNPGIDVHPEQAMLILYTSGTTGVPKGATLSHRALLARASIMSAELGLDAGDHFVAWTPMFHMGCADYLLLTHARGASALLLPKFDAAAIIDFMTRSRVGWLVLMPGILDTMVDALLADRRPREPVKFVGCMADLSPKRSIRAVTEILRAPFFNTFGTTETGTMPGATTLIPYGDDPISYTKDQSALCQMRVVGDDGLDVTPGGIGEMLLRGPTMFSGYWNNEEATREAFTGSWYHSGDVVVLHADGRYDYVGRRKYMIKTGGENVYPTEVERVLEDHDAVIEAAVIKAPSDRWGEVVVAFVATDSRVSAAELRDFCLPRLAKYKIPKDFVFISSDDLPRNITGKVERTELEMRYTQFVNERAEAAHTF